MRIFIIFFYIINADIAYQKYVLEHCGINVKKTFLININNEYVFDGQLKLDEFFKITDVTREVDLEGNKTENNLLLAEFMLKSEVEPDIDLSEACEDPYHCMFWDYCAKHLPKPSVFDLYRLPFKKKIKHYHDGNVSYAQLISTDAVDIQQNKNIK